MELILFYGAFFITLASSIILRIIYSIYKHVNVSSEVTGKETAKMILDEYGINNIKIGPISGSLTDYYNNKAEEIRLSEGIYDGKSVASVAVAAHECGHAIQYDVGYFPIKVRNAIVPFVNFGSTIGYYAIAISLFTSLSKLFLIGIILISIGVLFQLITLPVEINASRRGKKALIELGLIEGSEKVGVTIMLGAAAFTYIAGLLSSVMQVLRLILMFQRRDD